ncbi:MAG: hypothetical protein L6408_06295 [Nanoarchaeota archaeon]|nr:hypothetical protein [Nanoarchaeota archaeon]
MKKTNIPYLTTYDEKRAYGNVFLLWHLYKRAILTGFSYPPNRVVGVVPAGWFAERGRKIKGFSLPAPLIGHLPAVVVEEGVTHVVAHEIGHTYGLCDENNESVWKNQDGGKNRCPNGDDDNDGNLDSSCLVLPTGCPTKTFGSLINRPEDEVSLYNFMGNAGAPTERWISKNSYEHLLEEFSEPRTTQYPSRVLVSGTIDKNGNVEFENSYELDDGFATEQLDIPHGDFSVEILDDVGNTLHDLSFQPSFEIYEIGGDVVETDVTSFAFILPFTPETKKITIEEENVVKAEQVRTEHTPIVDILSPSGGEIFADDFLIEWNASDADGDNLGYAVLISDDSGESWATLAIDYNETSFLVDVSYLEDSPEYLVKVLATDGMNTGEDVSDSDFTIDRSPYRLKSAALNRLKNMSTSTCDSWFWWFTKDCRNEHRINNAIEYLESSLDEDYWIDDYTLDPDTGDEVFDYEKQAVEELMEIEE